jgi:hypothetical protein
MFSLFWVLCRCPETSFNNYQQTLHKKVEELRRRKASDFKSIVISYTFCGTTVKAMINLLHCACKMFTSHPIPDVVFRSRITRITSNNCTLLFRRFYFKYFIWFWCLIYVYDCLIYEKIYRVIHRSLRDFRPLRYRSRDGHTEGSMSTEGETLQVSVLPHRCSIWPPLVTRQMSIL